MDTARFKNWWFLALNGCIFTIFGVLMLFYTPEFANKLMLYYGMVMLAGGVVLLIVGINNLRRDKAGAIFLFESIVAIAIGIALVFFPEPSGKLFLIMIGIWSVIIGIIQLVIIVNIKGTVVRKNLFLINGLLTIGLGVALLFNPFQWDLPFMIKVIGVFSILLGILLGYFSFVLRGIKKAVKSDKPQVTSD